MCLVKLDVVGWRKKIIRPLYMYKYNEKVDHVLASSTFSHQNQTEYIFDRMAKMRERHCLNFNSHSTHHNGYRWTLNNLVWVIKNCREMWFHIRKVLIPLHHFYISRSLILLAYDRICLDWTKKILSSLFLLHTLLFFIFLCWPKSFAYL